MELLCYNFDIKSGDDMGRNRKKSTKWSADELLIAALIFPIALICAYPIILVWILVLVGAVILCAFLGNSSERKKKKEMQKAAAELDKLRSELDHSIIEDATKVVVSRKGESNSPFNEILNMCDDIENKLLEIECSYAEVEVDDEELASLFPQLEEYEIVINEFRNKKLVDLNGDLLDEVQDSYDEFIVLYDEFNELIDNINNEVIEKTKVDYKKTIKDEYKRIKEKEKRDEELEREAYRDELRYVWGLTEYQIGLVESGEYEPCQFSEEELEDDDYYNEDDC